MRKSLLWPRLGWIQQGSLWWARFPPICLILSIDLRRVLFTFCNISFPSLNTLTSLSSPSHQHTFFSIEERRGMSLTEDGARARAGTISMASASSDLAAARRLMLITRILSELDRRNNLLADLAWTSSTSSSSSELLSSSPPVTSLVGDDVTIRGK